MEPNADRSESLRRAATATNTSGYDSHCGTFVNSSGAADSDSSADLNEPRRPDDRRASLALRRAILGAGSASTKDLAQALREIDEDGNGSISLDELFQGLCKCGLNPSRDMTAKIFDEIDCNHSGAITFEEFSDYMAGLKEYEVYQMSKFTFFGNFCHFLFCADSIGIFVLALQMYSLQKDDTEESQLKYKFLKLVIFLCGLFWVPLFSYTVGWPVLKTLCHSIRNRFKLRDVYETKQALRSEQWRSAGSHLNSPVHHQAGSLSAENSAGSLSAQNVPISSTKEVNAVHHTSAANSPIESSVEPVARPPEPHPLSVPVPEGLPSMLPMGSYLSGLSRREVGDGSDEDTRAKYPVTSTQSVPLAVQVRSSAQSDKEIEFGGFYDPLAYHVAMSRQQHAKPVHFNPLANSLGTSCGRRVLPPLRVPALRTSHMELS